MGVSRVTLRLLEVSVLLPPSGLKSFLMVSSEDSTKLSTLPRKRLSPSTLPDIMLTPRIRNTSTETWRESRNTAQLLELSPPLKLRSVSSDKRSATLWKFKLTVVSLLPRRLIGLSPSSSLRLPSLKFSKRTRWLTRLPSLVVTELRVSSEELVYPDFLENLTEVFVKSDVLVLGIHLLLSGPLLVLVTSVITTEPNLTRRSITSVKVQLETLTTTLPLRLIPMPRTFPHYGIVNEDFILLRGGVMGPRKRQITIRKSLLQPYKSFHNLKLEVKFIDTSSKIGHGKFQTLAEKNKFMGFAAKKE